MDQKSVGQIDKEHSHTSRDENKEDLNIRVLEAHTGKVTELALPGSSSLQHLKEILAKQTAIATHEQILLCSDGAKLDSRNSLSTYSQLKDSSIAHVYLFNRQHLTSKPNTLETPDLDAFAIQLPSESLNYSNPSFAELTSRGGLDPMVKALPDYERGFAHHLAVARAYQKGSVEKLARAAGVLKEQKAQLLAVDVAVRNLNGHSIVMSEGFTSFWDSYERQKQAHQHLQQTFERDLEQLRHVELHPKLKSADRATLLDCVKEGKLRDWCRGCVKAFESLSKRVLELRGLHNKVESSVKSQNDPQTSQLSEIAALETELTSLREEVDKRHEQLKIQLLTVHGECQSAVMDVLNGSRTRTADDLLPLIKRFHEQTQKNKTEVIPILRTLDDRAFELLRRTVTSQNRVVDLFFKRLAQISDLQSNIKVLENKMTLFGEGMTRQHQALAQFSISKMPLAYRACVLEVARRRAFRRTFHKSATNIADKLSKLKHDEVPKREAFQQKYGQFLPRHFIAGLSDRPPYPDIRVADFDAGLPDIDVTDLSDTDLRFAKELKIDVEYREPSDGSDKPIGGSFLAHEAEKSKLQELLKTQEAELSRLRDKASHESLTSSTSTGSTDAKELDKLRVEKDRIEKDLRQVQQQLRERELVNVQEKDLREERFGQERAKMQTERDRIERDCQASIEKERRSTEDRRIELDAKGHELEQLRKQLEQLDVDTARKVESLRIEKAKEMADFKASVEKANANLLAHATSNTQQQQQQLQVQLQQAQVKQAELESACTHLQADLRRISAELDTERKNHRESMANSADLEIKYNKVKADLRAKEKETTSEKTHILDMSRRGADLLHANERLLEEKAQLEQEIRSLRLSISTPATPELSRKLALAEEELRVMRNTAVADKNGDKLKDEIKDLRSRLDNAKDEADMWKSVAAKKISFISLESEDMALFYKNEKGFWQAFSKDQLMFLSEDSRHLLEESKDNNKSSKPFVIGHIVEKTRKVSAKDAASNPYKLAEGNVYFVLTIEIVKMDP